MLNYYIYLYHIYYDFHIQIIIIMVLSNSLLDVLKMAPDEHVILELLADISHNWMEIGLAINIPNNILTGLRGSLNSDTIKLSQVLHTWITTQSYPVTWETIISAIEGPIVNNKARALEIRQHLGN